MANIIDLIKKSFVVFITCTVTLAFFELGLRVKNQFILPSYDIEMWRYSKELKIRSQNDLISHTHVKNGKAILQRVEITTNEIGARGGKLGSASDFDRNILFLGSSIVLGWGVSQQDTMSEQVKSIALGNGAKWQVVNAGVGNYNAQRVVNNYLENLQTEDWDTIVYGYFVNDAEDLKINTGNFITRNFMIGVLGWKFWSALNYDGSSIVDYYFEVYDENSNGYRQMVFSLKTFSEHCREKKIRCVLAMIPDVHQTRPYKLNFVHDKIKRLALEFNIEYVDLLPSLKEYDSELLWNDYNDPHPNSFAHKKMGEKLYSILSHQN